MLVTGASSGIGRETSRLLAELGAHVILVGRNAERLRTARAGLPGDGHTEESFDLVANLGLIPEWMKRIAQGSRPLTGIVHCAGIHIAVPLMGAKPQDYEKAYALNVVAGAMLVRGLRQRTVRANRPAVVFVSSILGLVGTAGVSPYSASKGAVTALARSLAIELATEGIRVNCVAPGLIKTEMTEELGRRFTLEQLEGFGRLHPLGIGEPRDVANAIVFLLSDAARWITGTTLVVDGGYTAQ